MGHTETFIDGVWYPSVTTITNVAPKPWLDNWKEKWGYLAERKTKIANAIGHEFHTCVEAALEGSTNRTAYVMDYPSTSARCQRMFESWKRWSDDISGEITQTEMKVISKLYTYSGTLDAVGNIEGKDYIIDWKTSSRIYDDMALQLSAYAQAYKEQTGKEINNGLIVHVSKDRPHKVTTKQFTLGKRVFGKFLKLRVLFDETQKEGINAETTVE